MKKNKFFLWYFPLCFLSFLAFFIFVKFIFIFFFRAAYEPEFIFDLTPYYAFTGVNNLHLILLSLIVVTFDVFLHIKLSKKNLQISFLPTAIMLSGLGLKIAISDIIVSNILHYIVFGLLLVVILMDHNHTLNFPDKIPTSTQEPFITSANKKGSIITSAEIHGKPISIADKSIRLEGIDELLLLHKETLIELRGLLKEDLKRVKTTMDELDIKSKKLDSLSQEIEERRKNLIEDENIFRNRINYSQFDKSSLESIRNFDKLKSSVTKEESITIKPVLDNFLGSAAIMKQGKLKEVNQPLIDLLGSKTSMILGKNLIDLISPEGHTKINEYITSKYEDKIPLTLNTILVTNYNKIPVNLTIKPKIVLGEQLDMILFRKLPF